MKALLKKVLSKVASARKGPGGTQVSAYDSVETRSLEELGLSHLSEDQRIGLRDDTLGGFYNDSTGELFRGFPLRPDDHLVDVGCGGGGPLGFASRFSGRITAIDITEQTVAEARANLGGFGADLEKFEFLVASAEDIPLPSNYATRIMCMEVLEHVDDPQRALSELKRIGKPGALYLISVPDERSEILMKRVAPRAAYEKPHHIRTFSPEAFEDVVSGAGLEIISHSYNGFFRALWLAMFWIRHSKVGDESHNAAPTEFTEDDPAMLQWSRAWNDLLNTPMGPEIKRIFDDFLPKSQIIVARKR